MSNTEIKQADKNTSYKQSSVGGSTIFPKNINLAITGNEYPNKRMRKNETDTCQVRELLSSVYSMYIFFLFIYNKNIYVYNKQWNYKI